MVNLAIDIAPLEMQNVREEVYPRIEQFLRGTFAMQLRAIAIALDRRLLGSWILLFLAGRR